MYVFPRQTVCGWAGLAYLPGTESWINGDLSVRVTGHELGHNLGLHHAGSWFCTGASNQAVAISSACQLDEYNDPWDVMGALGSRHNHGWNLQRLGVLQASNVQTVSGSGTYTMSSALSSTTDPTTLRIPRTYAAGGAVQDWYYLETRESGRRLRQLLAERLGRARGDHPRRRQPRPADALAPDRHASRRLDRGRAAAAGRDLQRRPDRRHGGVGRGRVGDRVREPGGAAARPAGAVRPDRPVTRAARQRPAADLERLGGQRRRSRATPSTATASRSAPRPRTASTTPR